MTPRLMELETGRFNAVTGVDTREDTGHATPPAKTVRPASGPDEPEGFAADQARGHLPRWKRLLDIGGAGLGLLVLSPVFLIVALAVKLTSRGPILFKHQRFGYLGKPFFVWKFRSLKTSANPQSHRQHIRNMAGAEHALTKLDNDARLTPVGKWLRVTALDEIPQLINVLRGEMSLVGPRPDVLPVEEYEPWQQIRFRVKPGLTGWWQVRGKNKRTFQEMMELDREYVQRCSLWFDLRILILTPAAIISQVLDAYFLSSRREQQQSC